MATTQIEKENLRERRGLETLIKELTRSRELTISTMKFFLRVEMAVILFLK